MLKIILLSIKNSVRNLLRNKRRSVLTGTAIIMSTIAVLLILDFNTTSMYFFRESVIKNQYGHIQIKKKGYSKAEETSLEYMLTQEEVDNLEKIINSDDKIAKHVEYVLKRINFAGLLLKEGDVNSSIVVGSAVDPDQEKMANSSLEFSNIESGEYLKTKKRNEIILGAGIAERLKIKVDDIVYVYSVSNGGLPDIMEARVAGISRLGIKQMDDMMIKANILDIQGLFGTTNIHNAVIFLDNTKNTDLVTKYLKSKLDPNVYEIFPWESLAGEFKQVSEYLDREFYVQLIIIIIVLIFLITNTVLFSVMERINEFGTLRAIGRSRFEISFMIMTEGMILGVLSIIAGIFLDIGIANLITFLKIPTTPPVGSTVSYPITIYVHLESIIKIFVILVITNFLATIYPVIKVSRIKIIDAIRYK